jgi:hypothetical protein
VLPESWAVGVGEEAVIIAYGDARIGGMKGDVCAEAESVNVLRAVHV